MTTSRQIGLRFCFLIVGLCTLTLVGAAIGRARAESPSIEREPAPSGQSAETLSGYARALFLAGRYDEAAEVLLSAYAASPQALFLFNAGQSFRKAGRPREALAQYQRFLKEAPEDRLAPEARGYVKDMQAILDAQEHSQTVTLELESERQARQAKQQALLAKQQALLAEQMELVATQAQLEKARHPPFYRRALFWGIVSPILVGAAAVAIGVTVYSKRVHDDNLTDGGSYTIVLPMP